MDTTANLKSPKIKPEPLRVEANARPNFKYYELILAFAAGIPFLSNLAATKAIELGPVIMIGSWQISPLPLDAGFLLFPLAYIFDDIMTEVYGIQKARRSIYVSAIVTVAGTLYMSLTVGLPFLKGNPGAIEVQSAFSLVFGYLPVLVLGSILAFLCGSFANAIIVSRMKVKHNGRLMGLRLFVSTLWGELFDTFVFSIFFTALFHLTWLQWGLYVVVGYVWKVSVEAVLLLFVTRRLIRFIKQKEGIDLFDFGVNRSPAPPVTNWLLDRTVAPRDAIVRVWRKLPRLRKKTA